ncbi:hypothetical protein ABT104_02965 [Streptomyces mobaraensis]|uniref:hypothetical protein n=1 Tax=Streptomyces mobaraensis TaxID=35621 RepID=UPI0033323B5D
MATSTLRGWIEEGVAPSVELTDVFWSVVRQLQQAAGRQIYTDAEWEAALLAAQEEGTRNREGQLDLFWENDPRVRLIHQHRPADEAAMEGARRRRDERTAMNAFVRNSGPSASSYLCWHAEAPVGKTALLVDYVEHRPTDVDVLVYFVSAAHGTNTRAKYEKSMAEQIAQLLGSAEPSTPRGVRQWKQLFAEAAEVSARRRRKLVLVVDGLDDDVAWPGLAAGGGRPASQHEDRRGVVRGSIAALLPTTPPPSMRVIVSLRRCVRFPDDLPGSHPLRRRKHLRALAPLEGVPSVRQEPTAASPVGSEVAGLLATAGGGLRVADLAELTGLPADRLDRLMQGPEGRSFVLEDPVSQTYALAGPELGRAVREGLGDDEVSRHTRTLLTWSRKWCTAGWPDGIPPYPLAHQLRLLTDADDRAAYVLDITRLRRLAATAGPEAALAQLDAFAEEADATDAGSDGLSVLAPVTVAKALLLRETPEVPFGAPALLVRLGEGERARSLARSAPASAARAMHLADVTVEMAYAGHEGVGAVARESAGWLARGSQDVPGAYQNSMTHARLLEAARTLTSLDNHDAARTLLRAVVHDKAAGTEALTEAAGVLALIEDADVVMALSERAAALGEGSMRARAAAVDLWGALARASPSLGIDAGDGITAICEDLTPSDGLGAVDVLAVAASALVRLPTRRHAVARSLTRKALTRITEALADPDGLTEDDRAHLGREMAGTLARLAQAVDDTGAARHALDDVHRLLKALPERLRIGVLGDDIAERARTIAEAGERRREQREQEAREAAAIAKAAKKAARRGAGRARSARTARSAPRRRASAGLPPSGGGPLPDHVLLLQEADDRLGAGNHLLCRELLETALRSAPAPSSRPSLPADWTVGLMQALGVAGDAGAAEAFAERLPSAPNRVRHLAALSLGCSLGGREEAGGRYAHEAARLMPDGAEPTLANVVAQALAHAGEGPAALATATGRTATEKRQVLTAVAAGLARQCPEESARIADPLIEALTLRIDTGSPFQVIPELAALLLAYPDVRRPSPRLYEALRLATPRVSDTPRARHAGSMTVLALLERLGCLPEESVLTVTSLIDRWRRSLRPGEEPCTELALLAAVDGDVDALWRHAAAAPTPEGHAEALRVAATHLSGAPTALPTDSRAGDRVIRTCLALARTSGGSGPPSRAAARHIVRQLLETDAWAHTVPLLPLLAPDALGHLSLIAGHDGRNTDGTGSAGRWEP